MRFAGQLKFPFNFSHGLHSWPSPERDAGTVADEKAIGPCVTAIFFHLLCSGVEPVGAETIDQHLCRFRH